MVSGGGSGESWGWRRGEVGAGEWGREVGRGRVGGKFGVCDLYVGDDGESEGSGCGAEAVGPVCEGGERAAGAGRESVWFGDDGGGGSGAHGIISGVMLGRAAGGGGWGDGAEWAAMGGVQPAARDRMLEDHAQPFAGIAGACWGREGGSAAEPAISVRG